jgi:hypothetical protein
VTIRQDHLITHDYKQRINAFRIEYNDSKKDSNTQTIPELLDIMSKSITVNKKNINPDDLFKEAHEISNIRSDLIILKKEKKGTYTDTANEYLSLLINGLFTCQNNLSSLAGEKFVTRSGVKSEIGRIRSQMIDNYYSLKTYYETRTND